MNGHEGFWKIKDKLHTAEKYNLQNGVGNNYLLL